MRKYYPNHCENPNDIMKKLYNEAKAYEELEE
jgi:hypothetical protein